MSTESNLVKELKKFGIRFVQHYKKEKGYKNEDLAVMGNISEATITRMFTYRQISLDALFTIVDAIQEKRGQQMNAEVLFMMFMQSDLNKQSILVFLEAPGNIREYDECLLTIKKKR